MQGATLRPHPTSLRSATFPKGEGFGAESARVGNGSFDQPHQQQKAAPRFSAGKRLLSCRDQACSLPMSYTLRTVKTLPSPRRMRTRRLSAFRSKKLSSSTTSPSSQTISTDRA